MNTKPQKLVKFNRTRLVYLDKFQKMIDEYNPGSSNIEEFFKQLIAFTKDLSEEEKRGIAENLSEEELAIFDLLTRPEMKLSKKQEQQVKKVLKELIQRLKTEKFVLDWQNGSNPEQPYAFASKTPSTNCPVYTRKEVFQQKCEITYEHVYDSYFGSGASMYQA